MPQIVGKQKKTSSDSKRHFTVVIDSGDKGGTNVPPLPPPPLDTGGRVKKVA